WLLPEKPLKATAATATGLDDSLAAPKAADSLFEIEKALSVATTVEERRQFRERMAERAGLSLSPGAGWALAEISRLGLEGAKSHAREIGVPEERIALVVDELRSGDLVAGDELTDRGREFAEELLAARASLLSELLADPEAERRPEVAALLRRLTP